MRYELLGAGAAATESEIRPRRKQERIIKYDVPEWVPRVVLDTSVIIFAMLFQGELSRMVTLWQRGRIIPVISKKSFDELITVLKYPKFSLSSDEMKAMMENEILPFFEIVESDKGLKAYAETPMTLNLYPARSRLGQNISSVGIRTYLN